MIAERQAVARCQDAPGGHLEGLIYLLQVFEPTGSVCRSMISRLCRGELHGGNSDTQRRQQRAHPARHQQGGECDAAQDTGDQPLFETVRPDYKLRTFHLPDEARKLKQLHFSAGQ